MKSIGANVREREPDYGVPNRPIQPLGFLPQLAFLAEVALVALVEMSNSPRMGAVARRVM